MRRKSGLVATATAAKSLRELAASELARDERRHQHEQPAASAGANADRDDGIAEQEALDLARAWR